MHDPIIIKNRPDDRMTTQPHAPHHITTCAHRNAPTFHLVPELVSELPPIFGRSSSGGTTQTTALHTRSHLTRTRRTYLRVGSRKQLWCFDAQVVTRKVGCCAALCWWDGYDAWRCLQMACMNTRRLLCRREMHVWCIATVRMVALTVPWMWGAHVGHRLAHRQVTGIRLSPI